MNKEVEYLKEHLYEIYKYKKSMKDLTYDMDIEHLLRTCKALDYSQKEIERLTELCNKYEEEHKTTFETWQKDIKENELLHSIIKEAREYIQDRYDGEALTHTFDKDNVKELLDILDKVEEK